MTTTHDDELDKILDDCLTEDWVSWDGEEEHVIDSFDKEKAKMLLIERDKARDLAARYKAEVWRVISEYPAYTVSSAGRVSRDGKILKNVDMGNGYERVSLSKEGQSKGFFVHRLVATAFLSNPDQKPHVNHIDGIKNNNFATNLEWATIKENERHSFDVLGKKSWNAGTVKMETRKCDNCGKKYTRKAFLKIKFCSRSCSSKMHWPDSPLNLKSQQQENEG